MIGTVIRDYRIDAEGSRSMLKLDLSYTGRKEAVLTKEKIVEEAESFAQSSEWTPTANRYKSLMSQWKAAARAPKDAEEALWQR